MPVQPNDCRVEKVFSMLSGKWKILIYRHLYNHEPVRYSGLRSHLPTITKKMLTQQLRELEQDGVIKRIVYPENSPRVEYMLTGRGRSMMTFLEEMNEWGERHLDPSMEEKRD